MEFSDVMFRDFGSKGGKGLKASRICRFQVKINSWTPKDVNFSVLQNGYLGFLIFIDFDPQNSRFYLFSKINAYQIQSGFWVTPTFWSRPKTGKCVVKIHTNNTLTKFRSNIFMLGGAMVKKKQVKVMMSLFRNAIFGISIWRTEG